MKTHLRLHAIIAAALLAAGSASAQKEGMLRAAFRPAADAATAAILAAQTGPGQPIAAKGAQTKLRLAGRSYRTTLGSYQDSMRLYYGSANHFSSDSLRRRVWDEYGNSLYGGFTYGKPDAAPDSLAVFNTNAGPFARDYGVTFTYDAGGNILTYEKTVLNPNINKLCVYYKNAYRPDGTLLNRESRYPSGGTFSCGAYVAGSWQSFSAAGRPETDSNASSVTRYYYTGAREDSIVAVYLNAATNGGVKTQRQYFYYNGTGLLSGSVTYRTDSLLHVTDTLYTSYYHYDALQRLDSVYTIWSGPYIGNGASAQAYGYSGAYARPADVRYYNHGYSGTPLPPAPLMYLSSRTGYHINAANVWDTVYFYNVNNGAAIISEKDPVVFNTAGFIDYITGYAYDTATRTYAATPYDRSQFYYDVFDDGTAPTSIHQPAPITPMQAVLYPNPATAEVQLSVVLAEASPLRYALYDAVGRQCGEGVEPRNAAKHTVAIPLQHLPSGAYYMQIMAGTEHCVKPFSVLR